MGEDSTLIECGYGDKLIMRRGEDKEWRWRRVAPNGKIVGASTEGYRSYSDCQANMLRQRAAVEIQDVEVAD